MDLIRNDLGLAQCWIHDSIAQPHQTQHNQTQHNQNQPHQNQPHQTQPHQTQPNQTQPNNELWKSVLRFSSVCNK